MGDEVLAEAGQLCRHQFGHYVMEKVMEHGQQLRRRGCLLQVLTLEAPSLADHLYASHVVEKALEHGSAEEQQDIGAALLALGSYGIVTLALTRYGSFVTRALLRSGVDAAVTATEELRHAEAR